MMKALVIIVVAMLVLPSGSLATVVIDFEDLKRKGGSGEKSWTLDGVSAEAIDFMRQYADMDGSKAKNSDEQPRIDQKNGSSRPIGSSKKDNRE